MAVWVVRAGRHGERQDYALDNNVAVIGWDDMPSLSAFQAREASEEACADDLVEAIQGRYDQFPEDLKAELPLKRIWTLVQEE